MTFCATSSHRCINLLFATQIMHPANAFVRTFDDACIAFTSSYVFWAFKPSLAQNNTMAFTYSYVFWAFKPSLAQNSTMLRQSCCETDNPCCAMPDLQKTFGPSCTMSLNCVKAFGSRRLALNFKHIDRDFPCQNIGTRC